MFLAALSSSFGLGGGSCDTSWTNPAGGDWNYAGNWDAGVPSASSNACITLPGTYTVTITGESVSAASLTLDGGVGKQTLSIEATDGCSGSADAQLTLSNGGTVGTAAAVVLTHTGGCANGAATLSVTGGTLTNGGTLTADPGSSDSGRFLEGNLTNQGSLAINANTQ